MAEPVDRVSSQEHHSLQLKAGRDVKINKYLNSLSSSLFDTLLDGVMYTSPGSDKPYTVNSTQPLQVPSSIHLRFLRPPDQSCMCKHRFNTVPRLHFHKNRRRSPRTPIAVTAAPAPDPCTISGRAPYRSVWNMTMLSEPPSEVAKGCVFG